MTRLTTLERMTSTAPANQTQAAPSAQSFDWRSIPKNTYDFGKRTVFLPEYSMEMFIGTPKDPTLHADMSIRNRQLANNIASAVIREGGIANAGIVVNWLECHDNEKKIEIENSGLEGTKTMLIFKKSDWDFQALLETEDNTGSPINGAVIGISPSQKAIMDAKCIVKALGLQNMTILTLDGSKMSKLNAVYSARAALLLLGGWIAWQRVNKKGNWSLMKELQDDVRAITHQLKKRGIM